MSQHGNTLFRHTITAPQIASVRNGYSQIVNVPIVTIYHNLYLPLLLKVNCCAIVTKLMFHDKQEGRQPDGKSSLTVMHFSTKQLVSRGWINIINLQSGEISWGKCQLPDQVLKN
jgi:hypothetical protein